MLIALGTLPNDRFVSCAHPPIHKGFLICNIVVEIAKDYRGRANQEFTGLVISSDLVSFYGNQARFHRRKERSGGAEIDVIVSR
jgi:hypothetical protein